MWKSKKDKLGLSNKPPTSTSTKGLMAALEKSKEASKNGNVGGAPTSGDSNAALDAEPVDNPPLDVVKAASIAGSAEEAKDGELSV